MFIKKLVFPMLIGILAIISVNAQVPGDLVIAEIGADPSSGFSEPDDEYFVVCNRSATARNLLNWTVSDNGSTITLPDYNLAPNSCVVIANQNIDFTATGYNCQSTPFNLILSATWFSGIANSNDRLGLSSPTATLIDGVSYGTDTTYLSPAATDVFNNSGASLIRTGYPTTPSSLPDTDTNADFTSRTGSPCDAPLTATSAPGTISGRARTTKGRGIKHAVVMLSGGSLEQPIYATTNQFGNYRFEDVPVGQSYSMQIFSGRHTFVNSSRLINLGDSITNEDFVTETPRVIIQSGTKRSQSPKKQTDKKQ